MTGTRPKLACLHCSAASSNGTVLCDRCRTTAEVALTNISQDHAALFSLGGTVARVRRRSGPADPTGSAASTELTPSDSIELAAAETTNMLSTWVRVLHDDRPQLTWPADTVNAMTAYLTKHLATIAVLECAGELVRELLVFERRLHRIVSQNQGHWYAGYCGAVTGEGPDDWCPCDLFVHPGDSYLRCPSCGHTWTVEQRRKQVIEQARDALLPVSVIARAAVSLLDGEPSVQRLEARLNKWVQRKQLDDYGVRVLVVGQLPRRVYRLGDVMDRLTREAGLVRK